MLTPRYEDIVRETAVERNELKERQLYILNAKLLRGILRPSAASVKLLQER